jgi:hypothetical protein
MPEITRGLSLHLRGRLNREGVLALAVLHQLIVSVVSHMTNVTFVGPIG